MTDRGRRSFLRDLLVLPASMLVGGVPLLRDLPLGAREGDPSRADGAGAATTMTTRIAGDTHAETAAAISQTVYPAVNEPTRPGAAILVNDRVLGAALPGGTVIHHPIDGAVLLTGRDRLPDATRREIERLHPEGVRLDRNVQVYLVGGEWYIGDAVRAELEGMGLTVRRIPGDTPVEIAASVDQYLSSMHGNHPDQVMVADVGNLRGALPALSWNAHAGDGFLYVDGDVVPRETREQLDARYGGAYMYLLGDESVIPPGTARDLARFGHVQRIPNAADPYRLSVGFAGYKDVGRNYGWWLGEWPRNFGWGIAESGHNFIFANPEEWQSALPACVESHRGKHGPMLLVRPDEVPDAVETYLSNLIQPHDSAPYDRKYNHGWIIGTTDQVSSDVQNRIHDLLRGEAP